MNAHNHFELEAVGVRFYSPHDEQAFFEWLKKMPCVSKCYGRGLTIFIPVDVALVDESALREFLALFHRYDIKKRQLARFDQEGFASWFRDSRAYWYAEVFADEPPDASS